MWVFLVFRVGSYSNFFLRFFFLFVQCLFARAPFFFCFARTLLSSSLYAQRLIWAICVYCTSGVLKHYTNMTLKNTKEGFIVAISAANRKSLWLSTENAAVKWKYKANVYNLKSKDIVLTYLLKFISWTYKIIHYIFNRKRTWILMILYYLLEFLKEVFRPIFVLNTF